MVSFAGCFFHTACDPAAAVALFVAPAAALALFVAPAAAVANMRTERESVCIRKTDDNILLNSLWVGVAYEMGFISRQMRPVNDERLS